MSSKIEKTIARQQEKIKEGQYYEAHQQLRVISARYVKAENWDAAIDILFSGAKSLLEAGQGGSGGDLCISLLDVYHKAEVKSDSASKAKLLALLRAFPAGELTRKRFVNDTIAWSSKHGEFPGGDPELHHIAGSIYAAEGDVTEAEKHLVLGTQESPELLAKLEHEWYTQDDPHTAAFYAARAVLPYLILGNLRAANKALLIFTSKMGNPKELGMQEVSGKISDLRVYPSLPLLNYLGLLLLAVQRGSADLFNQLKAHYSRQLKDVPEWNSALEQIAETYFGIKVAPQSNPLFDMVGSLLGGGGGRGRNTSSPAIPPNVD